MQGVDRGAQKRSLEILKAARDNAASFPHNCKIDGASALDARLTFFWT